MLAPIQWISEYVKLDDIPVEKLAEIITNAGVEVGEILQPGKNLKKIVAGRVNKIKKEGKYYICETNCGDTKVSLVTTSSNVKKNDIVPVALPGSIIANGTAVEKRTFNKHESEGMMLSVIELGLYDSAAGIWILSDNIEPGTDLIGLFKLDDYILNVEITPNRSDCLSITGIAREFAVLLDREMKYPEFTLNESSSFSSEEYIKVIIENSKGCPRYSGRMIKNIKVKDSPGWMQTRLFHAGLRPINNVVDITNYVLLEYGQPLHAFDYNKIENGVIVVRNAVPGEKIVTIDGEERELNEDILLICDVEKPVAAAGIMGGTDSEVTPETTDVLLESAYFDPVINRKGAKILKMSTEASYRFERGIDYEKVVEASNRASFFLHEITEGEIGLGIVDVKYELPKIEIELRLSSILRILGIEIEKCEVKKILEKLGFEIINEQPDKYTVKVPGFRVNDVYREIDLIEEIARVYGYDKIDTGIPITSMTPGWQTNWQVFRKEILYSFVNEGFIETVNYSFVSPEDNRKFTLNYDSDKVIELAYPLGKTMSVMRCSLVPCIINNLKHNISMGIEKCNIIESAKIYLKKSDANEEIYDERFYLSGLVTGTSHEAEKEFDFLYVKGLLEKIISGYLPQELECKHIESSFLHSKQAALLECNGLTLGFIGKINPGLAGKEELPEELFIFELYLEKIFSLKKGFISYKELPKYPSIKRDIALLVKEEISYKEIKEVIKQDSSELLEKFDFLSEYRGKQIPENYKSLAVSLEFRDIEGTMTDETADKQVQDIIQSLKSRLGIQLR